jgi:hypothetical protein
MKKDIFRVFDNLQEASEHYARSTIFAGGQHCAGLMCAWDYFERIKPVSDEVLRRFFKKYTEEYKKCVDAAITEGITPWLKTATDQENYWAGFHFKWPNSPDAKKMLDEMKAESRSPDLQPN